MLFLLNVGGTIRMGTMKHLAEKLESQRLAAINIAVNSNVLRRCENHDEVIMEGSEDIVEAKTLGAREFELGKFKGTFSNVNEMNQIIKEVVEKNSYLTKCPECSKKMNEE